MPHEGHSAFWSRLCLDEDPRNLSTDLVARRRNRGSQGDSMPLETVSIFCGPEWGLAGSSKLELAPNLLGRAHLGIGQGKQPTRTPGKGPHIKHGVPNVGTHNPRGDTPKNSRLFHPGGRKKADPPLDAIILTGGAPGHVERGNRWQQPLVSHGNGVWAPKKGGGRTQFTSVVATSVGGKSYTIGGHTRSTLQMSGKTFYTGGTRPFCVARGAL